MDVREADRHPADDEDIEALVRGLDNLHWNLQVQADILRLGERAVPALARFLLGPPSQFPQGRVLAAEALGRIKGESAFHALLNALDPRRLVGLSPLLRLSEEDVQNAVARQLARIGDRRAIPALLDALRSQHLVSAAEALVRFHETAALPWMVEGLEDAFKRDRFAQAILDMGWAAIPPLIATLAQRRMYRDEELLPSIERRAEALRLLGLLYAKEAVAPMRDALCDRSDKVRTEAALALTVVEAGDAVLEAVPALLAGLTHPDFLQRDRCAEALARIGPRCVPLIEQALLHGVVSVAGDTVPLTVNARSAVLAVLERLKGHVPC
ncbi:MAG TPA: HEAT repeat domain-containing protein [Nitrospiraceae bacterium]|jgi:HEAT repeat protein|nr:HEAT repeat domain-containing protein [Nitrospiraceae bacterium]